VNPVLRLLVSSFQDTELGSPTLDNYVIAYGHARDWIALGNSILYGIAVTAVSVLIAVPLAWAISRTDMPAKG
ncbi:hypothetical protein ACQ7B2_28160, partial [Escherichia coli]